MTASGEDRAREEGREAGRIDQILVQHTAHFATINGSVEKTAETLAELASEIRGLREDSRLDRERVKVAADTLATETERRREELEQSSTTGDRKFTRRERIAAGVLTLTLAVIGYLLGK